MSQSDNPERVLIVGPGAVGQVYARHLQMAGVQVDLYARPATAKRLQPGFWMYPLHEKHRATTGVHMGDMNVFSSPEDLVTIPFDQVWLCVPSPALQGEWLKEVLDAASPKSVVNMTPGYRDEERLAQVYSGPLVLGMIQFISYQSPLAHPQAGETTAPIEKGPAPKNPGIAYWLPPLVKGSFGGDEHEAKATVRTLKKGRFLATFDRNIRQKSGLGSALLMPLIAALEKEDWRFKRLKRSPYLKLALQASREVTEAIASDLGVAPPIWRKLLHPWVVTVVMVFAQRMMPFDIEVFLAYHFTKVSAQTTAMLATFQALAEQEGTPARALRQLAQDTI
jgi:ketopantoate reductase